MRNVIPEEISFQMATQRPSSMERLLEQDNEIPLNTSTTGNNESGEYDEFHSPGFSLSQTIALTSWLFVLLIGWLLTKLICYGGLPSDCDKGFGSKGAMEDLQMLALYGLALAWMVGMLSHDRYKYVFHRKRWWFFVLLVGTGPVWSALGEIPALQGSLSPGAGGALLIVLSVIILLSVVCWHLWYTWKRCERNAAILYTVSRLSVFVFYIITTIIGILPKSSYATFHLHHYLVAYSLALFATYNHRLSLAMLAITTGVFVQGLGAYNYASFFQEQSHCIYGLNDDGMFEPADFIAFTTRQNNNTSGLLNNTTPNTTTPPQFRLKSCLVDEHGRADLRGKDTFGDDGIFMIVSPKNESSSNNINVTNATTSCFTDLFPQDGECSSAIFPDTNISEC